MKQLGNGKPGTFTKLFDEGDGIIPPNLPVLLGNEVHHEPASWLPLPQRTAVSVNAVQDIMANSSDFDQLEAGSTARTSQDFRLCKEVIQIQISCLLAPQLRQNY